MVEVARKRNLANVAYYNRVWVHRTHYFDVAWWRIKTIVGFELDQTLFFSLPNDKEKKKVCPRKTKSNGQKKYFSLSANCTLIYFV